MRLRFTPLALLAALAGCATPPPPPDVVRYRCDEGRRFTLSIAPTGGSALIEFDGMRFALRPAPSATVPGEHFSCDVLTVWRTRSGTRVEMDGETPFRACVPE